MSFVRAAALSASLSLLLLPACSGSLPRPPTGPIPADAMSEEVPYPPPPAHVETIPPQKSNLDVWVDGQWEWGGKAWKWLAGEWKRPPARAYFTRWTTERRKDGRLFFARATWRTKDGNALNLGPGTNSCPATPAEPATAAQPAAPAAPATPPAPAAQVARR